ncbi:MAG: L,D-transpeptidase family protein [Bacteroidota bacterium]|nr:L,D-transpeptidase family protein [Bacteroidota bacterium]
MTKNYKAFSFLSVFLFSLFVMACREHKKPPAKLIVSTPEKMDDKAADIVQILLRNAGITDGKIDDSITLNKTSPVQFIYDQQKDITVWCTKEKWLPVADSLFLFIKNAKWYGLFPQDYHYDHLLAIRNRFLNDTLDKGDRKDAALWARADVMLTDAFVTIINDIKLGRLPKDSITLRKDSVLADTFYRQQFENFIKGSSLSQVVHLLEPMHRGYYQIKDGIRSFLDSADFKAYTYIVYPNKDSVALVKNLQQRLFESGYISFTNPIADSIQLAGAIKKYQKEKKLTVDGKPGQQTIASLNATDREKFIRIAITLDRYKLLPEQMPAKYIWVNLPAYYMQLWDGDTAKISSKIVVGKSYTRTPVLNSAISELITYPQWSIPQSIITKEILPAAKRDPGYFAKKGFSLLNSNNEEVDPYFVDWSLYKKSIPYRVVQGSGDDNALGVLKFNFRNKYAVYLHDTNQRYLFSRVVRALSHGCVRVQEWEKLTYYILQNDSVASGANIGMTDSVHKWLSEKEKHSITVKNRIPLFIRYFTCEGKNNKVVFYDDIYGEDRHLRERYFANK